MCTKHEHKWQLARYSVYIMLVSVLVASVWLAWRVNRTLQQRASVNALKKLHAQVLYDCEVKDQESSRTDASPPPGPAWCRKLFGDDFFASVTAVDYLDGPIDNISPLSKLHGLVTVIIRNSDVTDLTPLSHLYSLRFLVLDFTLVSDFSPLADLTNLEYLSAVHSCVSDLTPLAKMTNIRTLRLDMTPVRDIRPLSNTETS